MDPGIPGRLVAVPPGRCRSAAAAAVPRALRATPAAVAPGDAAAAATRCRPVAAPDAEMGMA